MSSGKPGVAGVINQRVGEKDVGITEYVSSYPGFKGTLKYRYSDFIVNEVDLDGKVVHLTNASKPEPPAQDERTAANNEDSSSIPPTLSDEERLAKGLSELAEVVGETQAAKVREFTREGSEESKNREAVRTLVLEAETDKLKRTRVHQLVRQYFPALGSDTVKVGESCNE
eukprot:CAMPEP_0118948974 /NCGR_PEP_ID=MMETSP1169-20130426/48786_1 /TAXON_ID=36882 /ORGANISM="Pyramimonas obovata, Strain CCMP722" /LENGTH=170 /DNA_ID=CAMNT_0006895507 /DNA_START=81 /DNA_END=590 /DNA_ORIENTATION=-